uniref:Putative secreted peptide n=1 Tax=Anopheles braziliensis TaxID=58242 RepID=A0A2M3ZUC4_9DIPT
MQTAGRLSSSALSLHISSAAEPQSRDQQKPVPVLNSLSYPRPRSGRRVPFAARGQGSCVPRSNNQHRTPTAALTGARILATCRSNSSRLEGCREVHCTGL